MKNAILLLAAMAIGLAGCLGGGGGEAPFAAGAAISANSPTGQAAASDEESADGTDGFRGTLERGTLEGSMARAAAGFVSEGDPEYPVELGAAPGARRGEVGAVGNSYYTVSTGPGEWEASLAELSREGALYVYRTPEFSGSSLCSTASFETSSESCAFTCDDSSCIFGLRVYGFEYAGTGFLLTVR